MSITCHVKSGGTLEFCVRCSLLEIYNEQLSDLFNPGSSTPVSTLLPR